LFTLAPAQIRLDIDAGLIPVFQTLPITATKLFGIYANGVSNLSWSTLTEVNFSHFEVETSVDGNNFNFIGRVNGAGNSNHKIDYSLIHRQPVIGNNYYRLKMFDRDGHYTYTNVVLLNVTVKGISIAGVYPNPFVDNIHIRVVSEKATSVNVSMFNNVGQLVYLQNTNVVPGVSIIPINNLNKLAAGGYMLEVKSGNETLKQKLIK
jgi:hypothetical protein